MIALVDCNSFYASCEKVFRPDLQDRAVVVLSNNDGCIIARSPEAKQLGIDMARPAFQIRELLEAHNVAVFSSNYALYGDVSERVMQTLAAFAPAIEVYSIDEAFLDLAGMRSENLFALAGRIRETVRQRTKIPTGVGIAPTKTLAKLANHVAKKWSGFSGICVLQDRDMTDDILHKFPVEDIWGIGRQYARKLQNFGIDTAAQLCRAHDSWILKHLTIVGLRLVKELRGHPCINLEEVPSAKKEICTSRSFGVNITDVSDLEQAVSVFTANCARKLRTDSSCARRIGVFLHTNSFKPEQPQYCNYRTLELPVASNSTPELTGYALKGLKAIYRSGYSYKKAGVIVGDISPETQTQLNLFDSQEREKHRRVMSVMDRLNQKMGRDTLQTGIQLGEQKWQLRQERLSPRYTTRWSDLPVASCE